MTIFEVTLLTKKHYGNGLFKLDATKYKVSAQTGEEAVVKAKKRSAEWSDPILYELHVLLTGID